MGGYCEFRKIETNYLLYIEWDYFNLPEGVKHGDKVTIKANVKDVKLMFSESSSILLRSLNTNEHISIANELIEINKETRIADYFSAIPF